ncbi:hypothetical protein [Brevibacterium sp. SMBL_HHYL_HB1]|uniref:hypothetical protein n=1 Tax=Brevibacterium sp. SMBL_HHYL_HB1 TaxID=2777556 RepID=UPI001BA7622C|nr:hypothetical protein [Brevibacterium sp. SMBL_HHYL_HB1]QUL79937.1 hypothetical protein IG171_03595 [Brevibacterium sp. SMBL_HHYL_HB1]
MSATQKTRNYAKALNTKQLIDALTYFSNKTTDHGSRVVFSILAAEACDRAGLAPRAVATNGRIVETISAAL